jgi:acyl-coenzyme A synthetase/AMP-(fatty) acid ligase/acyl carrier protein
MFLVYAEDSGRIVSDTLRLTLLSGDWIPLTLPPMLQMVRPDMEIISLGGATEASVWSIYHPITAISPEWKSIPYGRPLANQRMYVMREDLSRCAPWATGEICIGGVGVADGYFGDPEKTAASFVTHPDTGERLYRTGDLGRFNPAGYIEFLGRKDTQVKLRGYRIELGEIETAITDTGLCAQAACLLTGEDNAARQLVAFVKLKGTADEDELLKTLNEALADRLPSYMIPNAVKVIDGIPLTANGKVDRKRLAQMAEDIGKTREYVAPRNDTEERIAAMWQELLGVENVSVFDDFFALGGNSMIASRLIIRVQEVFEIELPFSKLFEAANVAALSELVIAEVLAEIEAMEDA